MTKVPAHKTIGSITRESEYDPAAGPRKLGIEQRNVEGDGVYSPPRGLDALVQRPSGGAKAIDDLGKARLVAHIVIADAMDRGRPARMGQPGCERIRSQGWLSGGVGDGAYNSTTQVGFSARPRSSRYRDEAQAR